jgi:hypothetical protein
MPVVPVTHAGRTFDGRATCLGRASYLASDTPDTLDYEFVQQVAELVCAVAKLNPQRA